MSEIIVSKHLHPPYAHFKRIFGVDVDPKIDEHTKAVSIIRDMFEDVGLRRDIDVTAVDHRGDTMRLQTAGIFMLNRTGLIDRVLEQMTDKDGNYNNRPFSFIMFDIDGVKQMDNTGGADYGLNRYASTLQHVVNDREKKGLEIREGRYGGDEFIVFLPDTADQGDADAMNDEIIGNLNANGIVVPYKNHKDAPTEFRQIRSKAKIITFPQDPIDQQIFLGYLNRSQIIEENEIHTIRDRFQNNEENIQAYIKSLNERVSIYPEGTSSLEQKIKYLCEQHTEIQSLCDLAQTADSQQNLLSFIEDKMYNPLFGDVVYSFAHIEDHIAEGNFSQVAWVEGKWIKEGNALLSYFDGDMIMKAFHTEITSCIAPVDRPKIKIANRAGAFVIGLEEGVSKETIEKISNLREATISIDGQEITMPLGVSITTTADYQEGGIIRVGKLMGEQRIKAEKKWYEQMIEYLDLDWSSLENIIGTDKLEDVSSIQIRFIHAFLWNSKRGIDRCSHAIEVVTKLKGSNIESIQRYFEFDLRPTLIALDRLKNGV